MPPPRLNRNVHVWAPALEDSAQLSVERQKAMAHVRAAAGCDAAGRGHLGVPPEHRFGAGIREAPPHIHGVPAGNPDTPRRRRVDKRQAWLEAAKQRKLDVILVWKLDRWGRSLVDLMTTLQELTTLGVGFVSLTEALALTTPAGRAFAGFLAVFAELERDLIRERIQAGITAARKRGKAHGRPRATANDAAQIRTLAQHGLSQAAIARHLALWRTSVRRVLAQQEET